jgi:hypothetical protein
MADLRRLKARAAYQLGKLAHAVATISGTSE